MYEVMANYLHPHSSFSVLAKTLSFEIVNFIIILSVIAKKLSEKARKKKNEIVTPEQLKVLLELNIIYS